MNRRRFLSTTLLSTAGLVALSRGAWAFSQVSCEDGARSAGCAEYRGHVRQIAELVAKLDGQGLSPAEKAAMLSAAICPLCGAPLAG